jgi:dipeptidyl aminopeptidase/acylaminoacyl peptidase
VKQVHKRFGVIFLALALASMACRLTSPTPAAWLGTPTAAAREAIETSIARTRDANPIPTDALIFKPTVTSTDSLAQTTPEPQATPTEGEPGPWLVYPGPTSGELHAYDISLGETVTVSLPEPVYQKDLVNGRSPDGKYIVLRAGSPENLDELALYQVDFSTAETTKISPLLSISLQREIVNKEGEDALRVLDVVTRSDGLAWSPDGRFLAFTAALDNESADLYVFDTLNDRIERVNGLFTHNASPFWSPDSNFLISQELGIYAEDEVWRVENVLKLRVPGYDDQNTLYFPERTSQGEVFLGWTNANNFISYSQTADGPEALRQTNVVTLETILIFPGSFDQASFDSLSGWLAFSINQVQSVSSRLMSGIYLVQPGTTDYSLYRAGEFNRITWDSSGMFIATSDQGVFAFSPEGQDVLLAGEADARISPSGHWMVAWGDGESGDEGMRLYQPPNNRALQTLFEEPVTTAVWQPDSKGLFLFSAYGLYQLVFPGLNPEEIASGFSEQGEIEMIWIEE